MKREYVAIIQAGGKGTRMRELTHDKIPKPLLKLNRKPMLEWQILSISEQGIKEFILIIGHLGELVKEYFGDGSKWNVKISYIEEKEPLGSAGALYYAKNLIGTKDTILIFGDVMFKLDWNRFISFHEEKNAMITLLAHPNAHPFDSDLLIVDKSNCVRGIDSKNNVRNYIYRNLVNAGLSIFRRELLAHIQKPSKLDFEYDLVKPLISEGKIFAYCTSEYVKDVGTPERFHKASQEQLEGIWDKRCLKNKQKAIFIDRDGTINVLKGFLKRKEDFELLPNVSEAIKLINSTEYLAIVVTNQPVVARGECSFEELDNIHMKMETDLGNNGAFLNGLFFCPHHPHKGYEGEISELKFDCECRKPKIGMLKLAEKKYNIDLSESWFIGDSTMDVQTGKNAGVRTVLVRTGESGKDGKFSVTADYVANDLFDAVKTIIENRG